MNTENQLQEQLDALNEMSLDDLQDLNRKYFPGIKHCHSKLFYEKRFHL